MILDSLEVMADNSFRNFHAKGLDYLCLHRSPELTIKAYFYELGQQSAPEVVCPHDHRYPFSTHVLAGMSGHIRYSEDPFSEPNHDKFDWNTPLNGGGGFLWREETRLDVLSHEKYLKDGSYWCNPEEIHTITINADDTILLLYQHADTVPINNPTSTFAPIGSQSLNTKGLYDRMPIDIVQQRLNSVLKAIGQT